MEIDNPRQHLALALDVDTQEGAIARAQQFQEYFGVVKVGLELFVSAGPAVVSELRSLGFEVFVDLKLHDIPTTVHQAAKAVARLGARYVTMHAAGGISMLEAGMAGLHEGALPGERPPIGLAVTVLTSEQDTAPFLPRLDMARAAHVDGVVCSALELPTVATTGSLITMVPGVRLAESAADDQARVATPGAAIAAGASVLVIGRTVTAAEDPLHAAAQVYAEVGAALHDRTQ